MVAFRTFIGVACLTCAAIAGAQESHDLIYGEGVVDIVKGNTVAVYYSHCSDKLPNQVLYFKEDGEVIAKSRRCNLEASRASNRKGRWQLMEKRFCLTWSGESGSACFPVVRVAGDTYKWVDPTGLRSSWELGVVKEGNPYKL